MKQRVLLKGADAQDLIHRISTVDLKRLKQDAKAMGLILNPQGKMLSFFEVTLQSKELALVEFEENFLELLEQYTFAEQYNIEVLTPGDHTRNSEKERISNLVPRFNHEFNLKGDTNPLEVNLRSAISDQKGCYPGQEVIEKIIAIGSPARKLCLLETEEAETPALPLKLFNEKNEEVGVLTSFVPNSGLAIIKRTHLKEGATFFHEGMKFNLKKVSS